MKRIHRYIGRNYIGNVVPTSLLSDLHPFGKAHTIEEKKGEVQKKTQQQKRNASSQNLLVYIHTFHTPCCCCHFPSSTSRLNIETNKAHKTTTPPPSVFDTINQSINKYEK
jgi:hypothetical protein